MSTLPEPAGSPPGGVRRPLAAPPVARTARRSRHRRRRRALLVAGAVVVLTVLVVVAVQRLSRPVPPAVVQGALVADQVVPGTAPALPWPAKEQAAVAVPAAGFVEQSPAQASVPVASLTKIMTAYLVLKDHPLPALPTAGTPPAATTAAAVPPGKGAPSAAALNGPPITLGQADVTEFDDDTGLGESSAAVQVGEVLTERQLLEGLLVHSANNMAGTLARWDAGSIPAFVAKMNATAATLGMHATHFADASGYNPQSMSTAGDMLRVATAAMAIPAFAQSVAMPSVNLPVSGPIGTYTPLLGQGGVVGIKSGFTAAAGGCDIMASMHVVDGHSLPVYTAVVGVEGPAALNVAGHQAYGLAQAAAAGLVPVPVIAAGQRVGEATAGGRTVPVVAARSISFLAWPAQVVSRRVVTSVRLQPGAPSGTEVGTVQASVDGLSATAPIVTVGVLPPPTLVQRLF